MISLAYPFVQHAPNADSQFHSVAFDRKLVLRMAPSAHCVCLIALGLRQSKTSASTAAGNFSNGALQTYKCHVCKQVCCRLPLCSGKVLANTPFLDAQQASRCCQAIAIIQISVCSAVSKASSTSVPRQRTVLSSLVMTEKKQLHCGTRCMRHGTCRTSSSFPGRRRAANGSAE
jgi:hypothetical protein